METRIEFGAPIVEKQSVLFRMMRSKITHRVLIGALVLVLLAQSSREDTMRNFENSKSMVAFKYNGKILYAEKIGDTIIIFDPINTNDADSDRVPYGGDGVEDDVRFPRLYADRFSSLAAQHPEFVQGSEIPTLAEK